MNDTDLKQAASKNRGLVIFGIVSAIIAVIAVAIVGALFLNAPKVDETPEGGTTTAEEKLDSSVIPEVFDFAIDHTEGAVKADILFSVAEYEEGLYVEYRLEDELKKIVAEGTAKSGESITETVSLKAGTNTISLKLRASDATSYTDWKTIDYVEAEGPDTSNGSIDRNPEPAYFDTPWAKGEETTQQALEEALEVGYGATIATLADYCMPINSDTVSATEIFPPIPGTLEGLSLKVTVTDFGNETFEVLYYWCE